LALDTAHYELARVRLEWNDSRKVETDKMGSQISVLESGTSDPERFVHIHREGSARCKLDLVDFFLGPAGDPFLQVEMDYSTLVMTLGGACTAVKTADACFALYPIGDEVRLTFQADDWPYPEQWCTLREEFNSAVIALL
jgi:hypothetical protein